MSEFGCVPCCHAKRPSDGPGCGRCIRKDRLGSSYAAGTPLTCIASDGTSFTASVTFESAEIAGTNWNWALFDIGSSKTAATNAPAGVAIAGHLGSTLSSHLAFDAEFERTARELLTHLDYNLFAASRIDAESGIITLGHIALKNSDPVPGRGPGSAYGLAGTVAEDMLSTHSAKLVLFDNGESVKRRYPGCVPRGVAQPYPSTVMVPVFDGDRIPGMVSVLSKKPDAFGPGDIDLLTGVVNTRFR